MDDEADDDELPSDPLPPDDRLWRHPSELAAAVGTTGSPLGRGPQEAPRDLGGLGRLLAVGVLAGLAGSLLTVGGLAATGTLGRDTTREVVVREGARNASSDTSVSANGTTDVVAIARDNADAIVRIEVSSGATTGSGVLFRSDGYLLTNHHVVSDGGAVVVVLADGSEEAAEVVGSDALTDIAVLKIGARASYVTTVLGSAVDLQVGEAAIAMGSPLGLRGSSSVSVGVISALGRRIQTDDGVLLDMIQTDAAINPGSSGGALLDSRGQVVGITTAVAVSDAGAEGLGFATPIDVARSVADEIIATGRARHAWLGVAGRDLASDQALEIGVSGAALVESVTAGGPGEAAGLQVGDVVVAVNGQAIRSMSGLAICMRDYEPGAEVDLEIRRDGRTRHLSATLADRPADGGG